MLAYLTLGLGFAEQAIKLGMDIVPLVGQMRSVIAANGDPSPSDWQALIAMEAALRTRLGAPAAQ